MSNQVVLGSNDINMGRDFTTLDGCKLYHPDIQYSSSWTHQYMTKILEKGNNSYLEHMKNKQDKIKSLLNSLVQDIRFVKKSPEGDARLTDWKPVGKNGDSVLDSGDSAESLPQLLNNMSISKEYSEMTLDKDVFQCEVNHYKYIEASDPSMKQLKEESNEEKMKKIKCLLEESVRDRLILSHNKDLYIECQEATVKRFSPVLLDINPPLDKERNEKNLAHKVFLENPKTWLTFAN